MLSKIIEKIENDVMEYDGRFILKNPRGHSIGFDKKDLIKMVTHAYKTGRKQGHLDSLKATITIDFGRDTDYFSAL